MNRLPQRNQFAPAPRLRTGLKYGLKYGLLAVATGLVGCVSVKTEHRVEPIHITMDVNVRLERELEAAFSDLDAKANEIAENKQTGGKAQ